MKIIQLPQFSASFKGSFIRSLEKLQEHSRGDYEFVYCFPRAVKEREWMIDFQKKHKVYFTSDAVKSSTKEILNILKVENPDILHTHFEGYDVPCVKAVKRYTAATGKNIKIIWHKRNQFSYHPHLLKKAYQAYFFRHHYGFWGKDVNLIYVNETVGYFVKKHRYPFPFKGVEEVIQNGIEVNRFDGHAHFPFDSKEVFTFGSLGSRNIQKRIDTLFKAGKILQERGRRFQIVVTLGTDTAKIIRETFKVDVPNWLKPMEETSDILRFYKKLNCYVSTSVHETFSNAIAEASMFGMPVIQSDIPGTAWNAGNPSAFLFKMLDPVDLADIMEKVMDFSKEEMKKRCAISRKNNIEKYGIEKWCERILDFYKRAR